LEEVTYLKTFFKTLESFSLITAVQKT